MFETLPDQTNFRYSTKYSLKCHEIFQTYSQASELHVGRVESLTPLFRHVLFLSVDEDGGATFEDSLWGALHHQEVAVVVRVLLLMDRHLRIKREESCCVYSKQWHSRIQGAVSLKFRFSFFVQHIPVRRK